MSETPWRDADRLERLYWREGMTQAEIADKLGCATRTVNQWMQKHDIETRIGSPRVPGACYTTSVNGYEIWRNGSAPDRNVDVKVHRLLAVAEFGFNAVRDKHIHHKNGIKWDNRPENIGLVTPEEHGRHHAIERDFGGLVDGVHPWEIHKQRQES